MLVVKLSGELVEGPWLGVIAESVARLAWRGPLVVVHGGGREIDVELAARGVAKRAVDGIRVTDETTLDIVIGVLAGRVNTRLVGACVARGVQAVGLTAVDSSVALVEPREPLRDAGGTLIDLERVGRPVQSAQPRLLLDLCRLGYVPIVASVGADRAGRLFNVNADTLAAHLASRVGAEELTIAGATAGVLDRQGQTIPRLDTDAISKMIASGGATAGMVAKLVACRDALEAGVRRVFIVDGRGVGEPITRIGTEIVVASRAESTVPGVGSQD